MLDTVLYCVYISVTATFFSSKWSYQVPLCPRNVWKIHWWVMTQSIQNFYQSGSLEQVACVLTIHIPEKNLRKQLKKYLLK